MPQMIQRACVNHAGRRAIGACVITGKSICAECSTRYKGVNYSKEGLEILQQRREAAGRTGKVRRLALQLGAAALCPILLGSVYASFWLLLRSLMMLSQRSG